jgi:flagellar protein FlgJ
MPSLESPWPAPAAQPPAGVPAAGEGLSPREVARLREVARDFEAVLLHQMLKAMRATVPDGGAFPQTAGRRVYEGLMDDELAKAATRGRGLGLAEVLVRDLLRLRGGPRGVSSSAPGLPMKTEGGR